MLRVIRACASLLLLEDEHCQGWRPVLCAGLPGGFHSGGLSFSDTAPLLLSLRPCSLRRGGPGKELFYKENVPASVEPEPPQDENSRPVD